MEEHQFYQKKLPRTLRCQTLTKKGLLISSLIFFLTSIYIIFLSFSWSLNIRNFVSQNLIECVFWVFSFSLSMIFFFYHRVKSELVSIQVFDDHWVYHFKDGPKDIYFHQIGKIEWIKGGHLNL